MDSRAFLNVDVSLTGRRWVGPSAEQARMAAGMAQQTQLPLPLCQILVSRQVSAAAASAFLAPQLRDLLPDPLSLKDMAKAAARFLTAVSARQRIAIFADYDVDGGASAALLIIWLRAMGHQATLYIPDRIDEGYGPNIPAMQDLGARHDLIICVDCGTISHDPIAAASCDVIVLDHHLGAETLPPAVAVVNPNRIDETGDLAHLCAAGVVFLMLVEANRQLRVAGASGPDLMALLDLVALATVADVAPLVGVNRAFVRQGLKVMARRERPGLRALADIAHMDSAPSAYALGLCAGAQRVNAGGRIGQADLGARLLATDSDSRGRRLGRTARCAEHAERRDVEAAVRAAKPWRRPRRGALMPPLVWAAGEGWHPGVVGIVASRLKEAAHRPAVVIGFEDGIGKGSARSIHGVDLGAAVQRLAAEGLLIKGGGHKMAAGLTVAKDQLEAAMARLGELLARQGSTAGEATDLRIDSLLMPTAVTAELIEQIEQAGPFGASAPAPRFAFADMAVTARPMGDGHLRISFGTGAKLEAVLFSAYDTPMGAALAAGGRFHLAGRVEINTWGGRSKVQLRVEDAARS
jgi:single-stranded-DNA-specific exonuclease